MWSNMKTVEYTKMYMRFPYHNSITQGVMVEYDETRQKPVNTSSHQNSAAR